VRARFACPKGFITRVPLRMLECNAGRCAGRPPHSAHDPVSLGQGVYVWNLIGSNLENCRFNKHSLAQMAPAAVVGAYALRCRLRPLSFHYPCILWLNARGVTPGELY